MTGEEGGFYSTEDADSEGEEGKYYVWSLAEINQILGAEKAKTFCYVYDVSEPGNWEGKNILNLPRPIGQAAKLLGRDEEDLRRELAASRVLLLAARQKRVPPGKDTKVLVSWNGLMIAALAPAGRTLKDPRYLAAAERAAEFILNRMRGDDGRLLHTFKDGVAKLNAYLDDYANLIDGLTRLYEATGEPRWIDAALDLSRIMIEEFADTNAAGFSTRARAMKPSSPARKTSTITRLPRATAWPPRPCSGSAHSPAANELSSIGRRALEAIRNVIENAPSAAGQSLIALDFDLAAVHELAVVSGADPAEFRQALETLFARFLPHAVVVPATPDQAATLAARVPLLADRTAREGKVTTYICENYTCQEPVVGLESLAQALDGLQPPLENQFVGWVEPAPAGPPEALAVRGRSGLRDSTAPYRRFRPARRDVLTGFACHFRKPLATLKYREPAATVRGARKHHPARRPGKWRRSRRCRDATCLLWR